MYVKNATTFWMKPLFRSPVCRQIPAMILVGTALLSGCTILDDGVYDLHPPKLPELFRNEPKSQPAPANIATKAEDEAKPDVLDAPSSQWWESFHNNELNQLVAIAMDGNLDLRVAISRIAQAEETARISDAALYPTVNGTFSFSGEKQSTSASSGLTSSTYYRIPTFGFQASYEADLWGKNGFAAASALALAQASAHYREGVALTMASDIAKSYVDYLAESEHIAVAEDNVSNARNSMQAIRTRMDQGDATMVEVYQQETTVANAEATLHAHTLIREKALNKIAALLGKTPSEINLRGGTLASLLPPDLSPGIPAQLLCRRPDIRRAEANMISAELDIKVARASLYPDITFSATHGRSAYNFSTLILPSTAYTTMVASMTQPLLDAGKNASQVRSYRAKHVEMVQTYHQAIISAVHDVEDALATLRLVGQQRSALVRAAGNAQKAFDLSTFSYDKHAIDFLSLLESQRTLYTTKDAEVSARADLFKGTVDLFTALGGGLEEPHC